MKLNIGTADKVIRIVLAVLCASLYFTNAVTGTAGLVLLAVGAILLLTAMVGVCPLYLLLGIKTNKK
jgi:hypothetical protein